MASPLVQKNITSDIGEPTFYELRRNILGDEEGDRWP